MYYSDEPITKPEEDAFGRDRFVENLAKDIAHWKGDGINGGSLVLALYGAWGSGKSSILNLLRKQFEKNNSSEIILFDPWYFNSTEQLIQTFLGIVSEKVVENISENDKDDLQLTFSKYKVMLSKVFSSLKWEPQFEIPLGPLGRIKISRSKKKETKQESPEDVRNHLRVVLNKLNRKIVILIDNLDRLDPSELLLMFKLVRLCGDFPNFVFVLAFDNKQVRSLIKSQGIDPDFLDKIVQIDIELPMIDQNDIDNFVGQSLQNLIKDLDLRLNNGSWDKFSQIYDRALSGHLINNLRSAKRYLNSLSFTISIIREEVDLADFFALEALRVFFPKIYAGLPGYKKELTTFDYGYGVDTLRQSRLAELKEVRDWLSEQCSGKTEIQVCEQLIGFLFPTIGAYIQNPLNPQMVLREDEYLANQRICISEYFDMYFKFRLPKGEISSRTFGQIEDKLNNGGSIDEIQVIFLNEKERFTQMLSKLAFHINSINLAGRIVLIKTLGKLGNEFEWILLNSWGTSGPYATRIVRKCLVLVHRSEELWAAIREVISSTPSLAFACDLIASFLSDNPRFPIEQQDKDKLRAIIFDRLQKEVLKGNQNIFATYPTSYYRILAVLRSEQVMGTRDIGINYVYEQLLVDTSALPKLLIMNATFNLPEYTVHSFEFERLKKEYNTDKLFAILKEQESTTIYPTIEQAAIDSFKSYMTAESTESDSSIE